MHPGPFQPTAENTVHGGYVKGQTVTVFAAIRAFQPGDTGAQVL